MQTTKISKERLNLFVICGKHYVNNSPKSKLWSAIDAMLPKMTEKLKKVEKQKEFLRLSLCKKTSSKHVDLDKSGRYQYTHEDNIDLLNELEEIDQELVTVPQIIIPDGEFPTDGLTYDMRKAFEGIVIPVPENEFKIEEIEEEELEEVD